MNSSTIHDNSCSLIYKNCSPKSYHRDIKYHMTLNIISSVHLPNCVIDWHMMVSILQVHSLISLQQMSFYKIHDHDCKPCHTPSYNKYKYTIKKSEHIRPTHLLRLQQLSLQIVHTQLILNYHMFEKNVWTFRQDIVSQLFPTFTSATSIRFKPPIFY